ncbi:MAG TPA: substrate-binding domain-containing protein [Bosea sp. (in: a-proteobacteria)]|jgi:molybdate transport system substrate-binding protein|uniref:molybdate ABC transporter substrate-binding protein n=1 Tax=Bosea sp. (in: a-proteobacteria) TaxID=1871050 RepID=UPI002DDDB92D|nr:substrate-binding domain-containing protein [Bosea sp. (in: a-proteobacteria)]HEV2556196.1 substrate-binding domain-containing protein [Bosea sp. (in: a-proteobacteria)]
MPDISILSGGAAQALVRALEPTFRQGSGHGIEGSFGAVGAMRAKLAEGAQPDVVILTAAIVAELVAGGIVMADSVADLGDVGTAIAVRDGDPVPDVGDAAALREALLSADAIYFPDPKLATAGIHFAGVIDKLGIGATVAERLRTYPNGASAMAALASAPEAHPIGCTQVTEIKAVAGVALVAELPPGLSLATRYTAAVVARASHPAQARELVKLLTGEATADQRRRAGFV